MTSVENTTDFPISYVRSRFPGLDSDWTFFDNAGGAQVVDGVAERVRDYLLHTNVQLGASYEPSRTASERVDAGRLAAAELLGTDDPREVLLGPSATQMVNNLARALLGHSIHPGDEVIVTNCDHETNIGPWRGLTEHGVEVKTWHLHQETWSLRLEDLEPLLTPKTRLVAFTHCSNVLGAVNPVAEITHFLHDHDVLSCVDGVAYAAHRAVDVKALGADFYTFSFYKVFGPHISTLYGKAEHFLSARKLNHFFYGEDQIPGKLEPGPPNYELAWALPAIRDYLLDDLPRETGVLEPGETAKQTAFDAVSRHEEALAERLLTFLRDRPGMRVIGPPEADRNRRVPTICFVSEKTPSEDVTLHVDRSNIGIRFGHFYSKRLIDDLGLDPHHGVVRVSMVHYNTMEEVDRLIGVLAEVV